MLFINLPKATNLGSIKGGILSQVSSFLMLLCSNNIWQLTEKCQGWGEEQSSNQQRRSLVCWATSSWSLEPHLTSNTSQPLSMFYVKWKWEQQNSEWRIFLNFHSKSIWKFKLTKVLHTKQYYVSKIAKYLSFQHTLSNICYS